MAGQALGRPSQSFMPLLRGLTLYDLSALSMNRNPTPQMERDPSPRPSPLRKGRGGIVASRLGNRTMVRGSWSQCMRRSESYKHGTPPGFETVRKRTDVSQARDLKEKPRTGELR